MNLKWMTLPSEANYLAPDTSEIRLLPEMQGGGLCHCTLPPFSTSRAIVHHTVEEIWYVISGSGQMWRKLEDQETVVSLYPGVGITIPPKTKFQFRNIGDQPLCILLSTMPPWPKTEKEKKEEVDDKVEGFWKEVSKKEP